MAFLTIVPARFRDGPATDADVAAARYAFPAVGLAIGLISLVAAGLAPYARREGTGRTVVEATTVVDSLWAVVAALALGALLAREPGLLASTLALLVAWSLTHVAHRELGGVTGDIL